MPNLPTTLGLLFAGLCFGAAGGLAYPVTLTPVCPEETPAERLVTVVTYPNGAVICRYERAAGTVLSERRGKDKRERKPLADLAPRQ
jgi:hypothetical protein